MSLFHHIHFAQPDPLANGLGDEITAEQNEDGAFTLEDTPAEELDAFWSGVLKEARKDPSWFDFSKD